MPREVPRELRQAVRDRLRMAEPAARIAHAYGVDDGQHTCGHNGSYNGG